MHLLFRFFQEELSLSDDLLALFKSLLNLACLLKHTHVVAILEVFLLLLKELGANVCSLVQFFGLELHIDEVCIL